MKDGKEDSRKEFLVIELKMLWDTSFEGSEVSRVLAVPLNWTFEDLHKEIQKNFGWFDSHLHEFIVIYSCLSLEPGALSSAEQ